MQAVSYDERNWVAYPGQRATTTRYLPLFQGSQGDPENFELSIIHIGEGGSFSPRHRHNFDQFRWPFRNSLNHSPKQDVPADQLGFFSEGTAYGPQDIPGDREFLLLQFGGASGCGYMSHNELMRGSLELKEKGEFSGGVYRTTRADGQRVNKDGYEAVWEHVNGKQIKYPVPRFREPIMINPEGFAWLPAGSDDGVRQKPLGTFNERGTAAWLVKIEGAARHRFAPSDSGRLMFLLQGEVEHDAARYPSRSAFWLTKGETAEFAATPGSEAVLLGFTLPEFT